MQRNKLTKHGPAETCTLCSPPVDPGSYAESVHYHQALPVYKSLNNFVPPYMKGMFQYLKDISRPNLRSATILNCISQKLIPKTQPQSRQHSGPNIWNNVQPDVRTAKSLGNFKRVYQTCQAVSSSLKNIKATLT